MNRTNPSPLNFSFMSTKRKLFVLLLLALTSISCSFDHAQQLPTTKLDLYQEKVFLWLPQQPLPAETALPLRLILAEGVSPQLSFVTGESMAMGRIPVQWQRVPGEVNEWQATLYLGACTEPQMQWRMVIPLAASKTTLPNSVSLTFWSE